MNDQYALISKNGRLLTYIEAANICDAFDMFVEMFGEFPDGAIVTNLTELLRYV